jgi:hypothetical protein
MHMHEELFIGKEKLVDLQIFVSSVAALYKDAWGKVRL